MFQVESSYANGRATHSISMVPRANLTVTCSVSNRLGDDSRSINVSSSEFWRHLPLTSAGAFSTCWCKTRKWTSRVGRGGW